MNRTARDIIMRRRRGDHRRDYGTYRIEGEYDRRGGDYRQGVKGTGRYGIGGSRYYGDRYDHPEHDYRYDYNDYNDYRMHDYRSDYADDEPVRLSKSDMKEWKRKLENADGSLGEHFDKNEILNVAEKIGVRYRGYGEDELCMTANMLYSDYCEALKGYVPQDKEAIVYTKMAKAFLEDADAPEGSEKLAIYYHCIANDDDE